MTIDVELAKKLIRHALQLHRNLDEELLACRMLLAHLLEAGKAPQNLLEQIDALRKSDTVQKHMDRKYAEILSSIEQQAASQDALQKFLRWKPTGPVN